MTIREEIIEILVQPRTHFTEHADQSDRWYIISTEFVFEIADQILKRFKDRGWVKLSDNQELPDIPFFEPLGDIGTGQWYGAAAYKTLIEDSKFRRVEELEEKC